MNVTLHTLAAFATGTALAARLWPPPRPASAVGPAQAVARRVGRGQAPPSGDQPLGNTARFFHLLSSLRRVWYPLVALIGNVVLHGALDLSPHNYPLPWRIDIAASLCLMGMALAAVRPRYLVLFAAAFLGGVLPDLMDQGPGLLNQMLGLHLPERELFGFHTLRYSVSAYLGHEDLFSALSHLLVVGGCVLVLWLNRRPLVGSILRQVQIGRHR